MQVVDETLIAEAGRRLAAAAPSAQVILFGSHACGEANPHGDLDFLVVEPEVDNEAEESVRLHRTLRDLRVPADVIVLSREYADRWREVRGGLILRPFAGSGSGRMKLPGGFRLPEGTTMTDVRRLDHELLSRRA